MDDLISRQAVLDLAYTIKTDDYSDNQLLDIVEVDDIKALPPVKPQPCEDAISRQVFDEIKELMTDVNGDTVYAVRMSYIRQLPPVKPSYTDAELDKMQELEQAQIQKAYELGQEDRPTGHWRHYEGMLTCSECGAEYYDDIMEYCGDDVPKCCPDCGAKMVEPQERSEE